MATITDRYGNPMTRAGFARGGRQHSPRGNRRGRRDWRGFALGVGLLALSLAVATATWRLETALPF